jgi:hypothetical protein
MKNIKYIQEFKKNPLVLNTKDGKFLNKLFHTSGQILPLAPLESHAIYGGDVKRKCSFIIYPVE